MKKIVMVSLVSASILAGSVMGASARGLNLHSKLSNESLNLKYQLQSIQKEKRDLIDTVKNSQQYKELQSKSLEIRKSMIDQQVKEGKLTQQEADKMKTKLDAMEKLKNDAEFKKLRQDMQTQRQKLGELRQKYTNKDDLLKSTEYKDLKTQMINTRKAIIDKTLSVGIISKEQADKFKAKADEAARDDNNIYQMGHNFNMKDHGRGRNNFSHIR